MVVYDEVKITALKFGEWRFAADSNRKRDRGVGLEISAGFGHAQL